MRSEDSDRNIVLVGFMGTGKTSVGKILAKRLSRPFIDVDQLIEDAEGQQISDIFEQRGEPYFRTVEKREVASAAALKNAVITTGGGAVLDPENVAALRRSGTLVSLTASPETILGRVQGSRHRPLLNTPDKLAEIRRLLEIRAPFYRCADYSFDTDGKTPAQVADTILRSLSGRI